MTTIQLLFTVGLAATWLLVVFPMVARDRDANVHGSAAGFERAMSVLRQDTMHRSTTIDAPMVTASRSTGTDQTDNVGPIASSRPTSLRAARRSVSSDVQLLRLRQVFVASLLGVVLTGLAAVAWQGPFWPLFVVTTLATGGFVAVLRQRKLETDRAKAVIRSIRRDPRSFVGRPDAHDFETLPAVMASHAGQQPFVGADERSRQVHAH